MSNTKKKLVWKITKDVGEESLGSLGRGEAGTWGEANQGCVRFINGKGREVCPVPDSELTVYFRTLSDDEDVDYEGRMTHALADSPDILCILDDYATPNVGSTILQIWSNVENDWVTI